ncbi:hypothetical protein LAZ67_1007047 [Cordylochernes scorpioides]|uniref:Integrase catalytic domain-containing protein n=1 Tax=Cordylochernes scorpioides TaxID=51811 RepID=A0ABY6JZV6_9ARAC|nr:hypothetical protein LAZ67_1007047 [Cordylochernes scorpioides]
MPQATISEWTWPEKPWHRLHLDLADNGRQFVSGEFEQFTKVNGIQHTKTSPYNPSTNGLAERYVKEFKNLLRKNNGKDDLETNLQSFLFAHRAFPQTVIKEFPGGTANEEKFKIKILEFNTKMGNPREVFHEAVRRQEQFTTGCEVYFRNYATGPKRLCTESNEDNEQLIKDISALEPNNFDAENVRYGEVEMRRICRRFNLDEMKCINGLRDFVDDKNNVPETLQPFFRAISTLPCSTAEYGTLPSKGSYGRRLQQSGLSARRPLRRPPLTQNHRHFRRQWCDERRIYTDEWNEIVFTDESRFFLQHYDGLNRV